MVCVQHKVYLDPKAPEEPQRHYLFRIRGTIKGKTVDIMIIIIDNGSTNNLISSKAVAALKLNIEKHAHPYQLGWIKSGEAIRVTYTCMVSLSIGKSYAD